MPGGGGQDRIASPVRPSASKSPNTMTRSPPSRARADRAPEDGRRRAAAAGHAGRPAARRGTAARRPRSVDPAAASSADDARSEAERARPASSRAVGRRRGSGRPSGARRRARVRMPRARCTADFRRRPRRRITAVAGRHAAGVARARASRSAPRRSSQSCQTTSSGAALKIEEYVPEMMPISSASTNSWVAAPPNRSSASSVRTTVKLVVIDRPNVCRIEWLTTAENGSPAWRARFSRIRSKTTIVSWTLEADDGQHRRHEQAVDLDAEERARGSRRCRRRRSRRGAARPAPSTPNSKSRNR